MPQQLLARHLGVQVELSGQVAHQGTYLDALRGRVPTEDVGPAARGVQEVEQGADGRRLTGPVGAQEPEELPRVHIQVEVDDPPVAPVRLRQPFSVDHRIQDAAQLVVVVEGRSVVVLVVVGGGPVETTISTVEPLLTVVPAPGV